MRIARLFAAPCLCALASLWTTQVALAWTSLPLSMPVDCPNDIPKLDFEITSDYRVGNAFLASAASYAVEMPTPERVAEPLEAWGFKDIKIFNASSHGAAAFLAEGDGFRFLVFRGTVEAQDVIDDVLFAMLPYSRIGLDGWGHTGMLLRYERLAPVLMPELLARMKADPKPLFLAGHSLGGAMALIFGMRLQQDGHDVTAIYTSAQPRVGDSSFYNQARALLGDRYYRLENPSDIIPHLPPSKDVAAVFGRMVPWDQWRLQDILAGLVERLNYDRPETASMVLSDRVEPAKADQAVADSAYWSGLGDSIVGARTLDQVMAKINERMGQHSGHSYLCHFAKVMSQQHLVTE